MKNRNEKDVNEKKSKCKQNEILKVITNESICNSNHIKEHTDL